MRKPRRRTRKPRPTYREETVLLDQGFSLVAGLDEVGRGPLAGPVLAAVAVLPPRPRGRWVRMVRDSKQLTPKQRDQVMPYLRDVALALEVGASSPQEVDELGIAPATRLAMKRAVNALPLHPTFLLLDAFPPAGGPYTPEGHREGRRPLPLHRGGVHRRQGNPGPHHAVSG